jgi:L-threonylcarbamoyladenylate synthase
MTLIVRVNEINEQEFLNAVSEGKLCIYPTDTIYGIGCNALNSSAVQNIRQIKKRELEKPFSVIAPSIAWIKKQCVIDVDLKKYLPGKYTVILKKRDKHFLKEVSAGETLGVRIPDHPFTKLVQKTGVPFVTTSVNISGEKPVTKISEIPAHIKNQVDLIIDAGILDGKPSTLIIGGKEIVR